MSTRPGHTTPIPIVLRSAIGPLARLGAREQVPGVSLASPAVWLPAVTFCAIGLALRLIDFNRGLWEDELTSGYYTQIGIKNVIDTIARNGAHPPLYFLVVAFDARIGMDLLPAVRIPSLVAGVLTVAVLYLLVLRLAGRGAALVAGALATVAPIAVWYSDEGRMYALVWFFVLASYALLVWGHDSRYWRVFATVYAATVGLALWTDYSAALALLPQPLLIMLLRNRRWFLACWMAGWLSLLPWLFFLREQYARIQAQQFPKLGTGAQAWTNALLDLAGLRADYASLGATLPAPAIVGVLGILALATLVAAVAAARSQARISITAACLTAGAVVVDLALGAHGVQAVLLPRVMGVIAFGFIVLCAAGVAGLLVAGSRGLHLVAAACAALLLGCSAAATADVVQNGTNGVRWGAVANTIQSGARPGDELIYYPVGAKYAVDPYLPASSPWRNDFNGSWPKDAATMQQYFAAWTSGKQRVWLVFYAISGVDPVQDDGWLVQDGLCRVMGDPTTRLGVLEYEATGPPC